MQKKFDDFQADLKANEVHLAEMNEIAMQLVSLEQTEATMKIQAQLEDLNQKWTQLEKVTKEQGDAFQKVHEVQMFHVPQLTLMRPRTGLPRRMKPSTAMTLART